MRKNDHGSMVEVGYEHRQLTLTTMEKNKRDYILKLQNKRQLKQSLESLKCNTKLSARGRNQGGT